MTVEPLDPNSREGRQVTEHLSEWVADIIARFIREGHPLPACLLEPQPPEPTGGAGSPQPP